MFRCGVTLESDTKISDLAPSWSTGAEERSWIPGPYLLAQITNYPEPERLTIEEMRALVRAVRSSPKMIGFESPLVRALEQLLPSEEAHSGTGAEGIL